MSVISKDIEKTPATVFSYLLYHGGIEPVARKRRADCLSFEEREVIAYAASPVICSVLHQLFLGIFHVMVGPLDTELALPKEHSQKDAGAQNNCCYWEILALGSR